MSDRPFVCSCGERYYSREDRQACESVHKVTTLEHGGEVWVRLSAVHPMQDKIIALESKLDAIRLKCLDELKHDRRTAFEEGRMDFADVIWRMIVQEPKP